MTLVDTSVWVDLFAARDTPGAARLEGILRANGGVAICGINLTEILQGLRDEVAVRRVRRRLAPVTLLPMGESVFLEAAALYRTLRGVGITIRKTNDCIIAAAAIEHGCPLLHADRDFTMIARHTALEIVPVD